MVRKGDWEISDFDETQGHRSTDGLQIDVESSSSWWNSENVEGKSIIDGDDVGTIIPIVFWRQDAVKGFVPFTSKMENYVNNFLNLMTEWTEGCIKFLDMSHPNNRHRISQNLVTWRGLYQKNIAYVWGKGDCFANHAYWARTYDVTIAHELFHCFARCNK